jgi:hypothetical protein
MSQYLRPLVSLSIVFVTVLAASGAESPHYSIGPVVTRKTAEGTYETMEFAVSVRGQALNPFRSAEMALDVIFRGHAPIMVV